ncbi:hypothetical protein BKI52_17080 [marine bacterium AO1-C]|nr:hypothetical protein BKI52_17080 [marine bacterium AO1-C]
MFPFQITLKSKITSRVASRHSDLILEHIQGRFAGLDVHNFQKNQYQVSFKTRLFSGQGSSHILAPINAGSFEVQPFANAIIYKFSMLRTAILFLCFGVLAILVGQNIVFSLSMSIGGYLIAMLGTFIRLKFFVDKLSRELEHA